MTAAASLAAGSLFGSIGYGLARCTPPSREARLANDALTVWWYLLAAGAVLDGLVLLAAAAGSPPLHLYLTLNRMKVLVAAFAMWSLGYYVLYLLVGGRRLLVPAFLGAVTQTGLFLYVFQFQDPVGIQVGTWATQVVMANPAPDGSFVSALTFVLFYAPPIVFGVVGAGLLWTIPTPTARHRLAALAAVAVLWHVTAILWFNPNGSVDSPLLASLAVVQLLVGVLAYLAYYPPERVRETVGLTTLAAESQGPPAFPTDEGVPEPDRLPD